MTYVLLGLFQLYLPHIWYPFIVMINPTSDRLSTFIWFPSLLYHSVIRATGALYTYKPGSVALQIQKSALCSWKAYEYAILNEKRLSESDICFQS
jgi:hypothetical protein